MSETGEGEWRYFGSREVPAARQWAEAGGIAVHENIFRFRGRRTCHLLARNEPALFAAARSLGCRDEWFHRSSTPHFDLVEIYLERALIRCGVGPSAGA
ncbi:MAG: DUF4031 domain-containing protein [Gemmatimonadales bacterium]